MWSRQLNIESGISGAMVANNGGTLWSLGYKTERPNTVLKTTDGGISELLGGSFYPIRSVPLSLPLIINNNAQHSLIYIERSPLSTHFYTIHVRETRNGQTKSLLFNETYRYYNGTVRMVPLFVGRKPPVSEGIPPPPRLKLRR
jgi:hypothetical protein